MLAPKPVPQFSRPIYYDHRIRQEGFGIEMMTDAAGMNAATIPVPILTAVGPESGEPSA